MSSNNQDLRQIIAETPVVILAGGIGSRLSEETTQIPKPMVEIGGIPILIHIMDMYSCFGFENFVICCGYKGEFIRNYFLTLPFAGRDIEINFSSTDPCVSSKASLYHPVRREKWQVTILETGLSAMTGSRVHKAIAFLASRGAKRLCLTYGDGLCDVNLKDEFSFHLNHGKVGTVLAVRPPTRFGILEIDGDSTVQRFSEKPQLVDTYINGGFFIFEMAFSRYLSSAEDLVLEQEPLKRLAKDRKLLAFRHDGFWQCMDTKREKDILENLYLTKEAPWVKAHHDAF